VIGDWLLEIGCWGLAIRGWRKGVEWRERGGAMFFFAKRSQLTAKRGGQARVGARKSIGLRITTGRRFGDAGGLEVIERGGKKSWYVL
jgi:hypothetical protein